MSIIDEVVAREFAKRNVYFGYSREELKEVLQEVHDAAVAEVRKDAEIAAAARNLIVQKGRHNTEIAYERLCATIAAAKEK